MPLAIHHIRAETRMTPEQCDYVVVGAGSAGCVLADRLSANGKYRVVLLEAGGKDRNPWIHIPLGYGRTMFDARVNWMFETEPEPALENRRIKQPRGKVLGGSSSINGLSTCAARPRITTTGASWAIPDGAMRTCCPISRNPRTRPAAPIPGTGSAGRSPSAICPSRI